MTTTTKIIVGLSGGVDSSVSALLLKQAGFNVEGLFMKNWEEDDTDDYCSAAEDLKDAEKVCETIGIPLHRVNFSAEYWDTVFEHFLQEYKAGRTPNPDILCNKEIKFRAFLDHAHHLGAIKISTGHYARIKEIDGKNFLLTGLDNTKDQSYFLYTLNQAQLAQSLFPVGELEKSYVRKLAEKAGLITHNKKDSTGICFIGERRFKTFLSTYLPAEPGIMKTPEGKIIGEHDGLMYYTLGQRQGLKIGGRKGSEEAPWYVVAKEIANNILIVAQRHDHPLLYGHTLMCTDLHWVSGHAPAEKFSCTAKTRYRQPASRCDVMQFNDNSYKVTFEKPQWAITPGQSVVFYHEEICLGGGVIE